jgi:hypothetical protein
MLVGIHWSGLRSTRNSLWDDSFCLYAYVHPRRDWLLYVGKALFSTVRERLRGVHKDWLYREIARCYNLEKEDLRFFHGRLVLEE